MKRLTLIALTWCALAATAAAQSSTTDSSPKAALSTVRSNLQELQKQIEVVRVFLAQFRSLVEAKPNEHGGGDEAKQAYEQALTAWSLRLERLLRRLDSARASLADSEQKLEASLGVKLPASLAADVETARQQAAAERESADEAKVASKPEPEKKPGKAGKAAKSPTVANSSKP
jgi:hypothetical protein